MGIHSQFPGDLKVSVRDIYDAYAKRYDRRLGIMELLGIGERRRSLLRHARGRVLEVAVGTGMNLSHYGPDVELHAVDFSEEMIQQAKHKALRMGRQIFLHAMDAERLAFADQSFDTVVSTLSTCTFPSPVVAMREMGRVVRPGGVILLMEQGYSDRRWLRMLQDLRAERQFQWLRCRWKREPHLQAEEAGLRIESDDRIWLGMIHVMVLRPSGA